jgi:hypothetical protein
MNHTIFNETIYTDYDYLCGWRAYTDNYDPTPIDYETPTYNEVGEGVTEIEAIVDLFRIKWENEL